ncbi:TlpA family protein disulfide reductase [Corynebacterium appendicis]|uniref:TlpA family protein disulfide reductase n=1 Tax=Corynebacterium appendicis TaxID=163202 RepID=UPI0023552360|nr:TlpA disulfide reductase family protein [Corynebacterium appendicis]
MKKQVWLSVAVLAAVTALVVAAAVSLLRPADSGDSVNQAEEATEATSAQQVQARPDCPGGIIGGVDLPCLGGNSSGAPTQEVTVVNVWAWWCEPCRDELPALEEFANDHPEYSVVGVHADTNAANGAALLNDLGVNLPSYQDSDNAFAGQLGLPGVVPVTVVFRGEEKVGVVGKAFSSSSEIAQAVQEVL